MSYEEFEGSGAFGDGETNRLILETTDTATAFERLRAQRWIDTFRVETDGQLDIEATAREVDIPIVYEMPLLDDRTMPAAGCLTGMGADRGVVPITVRINPNKPQEQYSLTFGHELGHLFVETAAGVPHDGFNQRIEDFCEFFGTQMILPLDKLVAIETVTADTISQLMVDYSIGHQTAIHQLMLAGKLPRRIIMDTSIGEANNPVYAHKVRRHVVCVDCSLGCPHSTEVDETTPVYDFTKFEWGNTPFVDCLLPDRHDLDAHIELNKAYGCWSAEDDLLIPAERARREPKKNDLFVARLVTLHLRKPPKLS